MTADSVIEVEVGIAVDILVSSVQENTAGDCVWVKALDDGYGRLERLRCRRSCEANISEQR